jgi:hypothetical protein
VILISPKKAGTFLSSLAATLKNIEFPRTPNKKCNFLGIWQQHSRILTISLEASKNTQENM